MPAWSAQNGLYWTRDLPQAITLTAEPGHFIYVGRLVPEKEPELMIRAFTRAQQMGVVPQSTKLIIVGTGTLADSLIRAYAQHPSIEFIGECTDLHRLADLYAQSLAAVSPGAVGLAAVQAFGFGVPLLLPHGVVHNPEIEACAAGFNCEFFEADNAQALADLMAQVVQQRAVWVERRAAIAQRCRAHYSLDAMLASFSQAIDYFLSDAVVT
ncbi:MAG: hypothetical protein B7X06_03615 [Verrucomicrobia bacterium 21-51-4]|nr:MAG: hypothetical protein B7X06_03615 [Verrucomicrobia bacterium 21-51-4]